MVSGLLALTFSNLSTILPHSIFFFAKSGALASCVGIKLGFFRGENCDSKRRLPLTRLIARQSLHWHEAECFKKAKRQLGLTTCWQTRSLSGKRWDKDVRRRKKHRFLWVCSNESWGTPQLLFCLKKMWNLLPQSCYFHQQKSCNKLVQSGLHALKTYECFLSFSKLLTCTEE